MTKERGKRRIAFFLAVLLVINCFWNTGMLQTRAEELDPETLEYLAFLNEDLQTITDRGEIMAVLYREQKLPVRTAPDSAAPVAAELYSGQTVFITGVAMDSDYGLWSQIGFYYQQEYLTGYIERDYLMCTDERYKEWEAANGLDPSLVSTFSLTVSDGDVRSTFDEVNQFPESYREALDALKEEHPNWHFTPLVTDLDWNTVIDNEMGAKSQVYYTFEDWNKDGLYDEHNWYYATRPILEYYMDPRNGLTEERVFQFEQPTYNESYHTEAAMDEFLTGTFMDPSKTVPGTTLSYPYLIWTFGKDSNRRVSPFYLAARIIQEQGRQGTGDLISGTYPGYEGYYNYFNISATGTTHAQVVQNGLKYAKGVWGKKYQEIKAFEVANGRSEVESKALYSAYFALEDGADFIARNYIQKGQDTLYLQKYNVNPNGYYDVFTHQYMQNISAPTTEAKIIRNLYNEAGALDKEFIFKIPVYLNMPETAVPYPTIEENLYLTIPEGYDTSTIYVDGVAYPTETKYGYQVANLPNTDAKTAIAYKYNASGVPEGMYVWELTYTQKNKYQATAVCYPVIEIPEGYDTTTIYVDGVAYPTETKYGYQVVNLPNTDAKTAIAYKYDASGVPEDMYVWELTYTQKNKYQATVVPYPAIRENLYLTIPEGYDTSTIYVDGVAYPTETKYGYQVVNLPNTDAKTAIAYKYNASGVPEGMYVWELSYTQKNKYQATAVPYPVIEENLYLTIPEGYDTTTIYVDGVAYPTETKYGYQVANLPNTDAKTAIAYKYNASGVPEGMYVWELMYTQKNKYQATALPNFENLLSYHGFSIRITGKSGMRFMSGITEAMKQQMTAGTVDGYSLVEYGTLIMNDSNRAKYPMVLDGKKVKKGISFGVENGQPVDRVYKTVDGRVRYTAVLINLEIPYYQTVIAFRPYAVLQKDGKQVVLYGGIRTNSIYSLSKKALEHGLCAEGSPEDIFVKQLIADADAYAAERAAAQEEQ